MAARARPTARRIELGHELRELRKQAGLTLEEAVEGLPLSDTKLYRVEIGLRDLRSSGDLRTLLARYHVEDEEDIERLMAIQRESSSREWWTQYKGAMPSGMPRFVGIESAAIEIQAFHPCLVLGLLQTRSYAQALYETMKPIEETTTEFIRQNVDVRMRRKEALTREEEPLRLWAVLYEPALRYIVGNSEIMREQYDEIIKLTALDHVTVQVLPQTVRGYLAVNDFSILNLGDTLPSTVQVDNAWGASSVTDTPREVGKFSRRFNALVASSLPPEDTPRFLKLLSREITE
ncbi:helix-turn-helix domain-containing protein [Streptomyces alkaliterrae]|uniref:Helix-turn-helix domain-containing protein n=1 Tax=Streptomyces alkaliterrae TaxID=2213162 RepID=A0A5P0YYC6_9ACTN|nr:helix-turn-helix transcriptional regulator [Streptomyces alkaliterrae]MBB1261386.1 helix-turn-helix domain-containing protein [Streptomyces alkaliterrae]MQS03439.1 helix-turn-helix domain-containing protein [Streptomyces alkaliterrae]